MSDGVPGQLPVTKDLGGLVLRCDLVRYDRASVSLSANWGLETISAKCQQKQGHTTGPQGLHLHAEDDYGERCERVEGAWVLRQDWPWSGVEEVLIVCSHQPAAPEVLFSVVWGEVHLRSHSHVDT